MGQKFFSKINNNALSCILSAYLENGLFQKHPPTECGKFQNILLSMEFQNLENMGENKIFGQNIHLWQETQQTLVLIPWNISFPSLLIS